MGYGWIRISKKFPNISPHTICSWIYFGRVPDRRFCLRPNLALSPSLSYILGVLLGDGFVYKHTVNRRKGRHDQCYTVALVTKDYEFAEKFAYALREIGLHPCIFQVKMKRKNPNWSDVWRIEATSVVLYKWFKNLNPSQIKQIARAYPADFIRGFYDSDGCLSQDKYITMHKSNKFLIELIRSLLCGFGFKTKIRIDQRQGRLPVYCIRILGGIKASKKFCELIQPSIPRKRNLSRKWSKEKNKYVSFPAESQKQG